MSTYEDRFPYRIEVTTHDGDGYTERARNFNDAVRFGSEAANAQQVAQVTILFYDEIIVDDLVENPRLVYLVTNTAR